MDAQLKGSRWGTVSASVMRRPGLSVAAKTVYAALSTYADRAGWIWVRQETIASDLERSRAWVHAAIAELEGQGLILHDRQYVEGRQRASRYRLQDGLLREAREATGRVSEENDSAVQPADTNHHDDSKDSLGHAAGESSDEPRQRAGCGTSASAAALVPSDWVPSAADAAWARSRHPRLDVLAFTETFVLSCRAKGYRYSDPSAAWRRWLIEPKGRLPMLGAASSKMDSNQDHGHDDDRPRHGHRGSAFPSRTPSSGLADRNAERAAACLERILGRRAAAAFAGPAA
jgi:hypothetical protein